MRTRTPLMAGLAVSLSWTLFPSSFSGAEDTSWRSDLETWRTQRAANLQKPGGWLSLVGLEWLKDGDNSFGSAADNQIHIAGAAPHLGVLHLKDGTVRLLRPASGFPDGFQLNGKSAEPQALGTDADEHTSKLTAGTLAMMVIKRGDRFALRVKDSQAPTRLNFRGLHWYVPDAKFRVPARWIPYHPPKILSIPTIIHSNLSLPSPGAAEFVLGGKTYRLEPVIEEPGDTELFFILRDATSRTTTYGAGRFLYTAFPDHGLAQPGELWLDFNRLCNPPCAFTPYATCPLPPPQNRLPVAIPAGEKRYHD